MAVAYAIAADWRPGAAAYIDSADDTAGGEQADRGAIETTPADGVSCTNETAREIIAGAFGQTAQRIECVIPRDTARSIVHPTAAATIDCTAAQRQGT